MVEPLVLTRYVQIPRSGCGRRVALPVSSSMLVVGGFLITGVDFVGIWILFQNVDDLGGFELHEVAFLYGGTRVRLRAWRTCSSAGSSGSAR